MKEGEYKCYKCNGSGNINEAVKSNYYHTYLIKCPICKGTGKLDWISNIIEPKNNGKLEIEVLVKPIKSIEMVKLNFVIDCKNRTKKRVRNQTKTHSFSEDTQ